MTKLELPQVQLRKTDGDKNKTISDLSEQNPRLMEYSSRGGEAAEEEWVYKHMTRLETVLVERELEIKMVSEKKVELEWQMNVILEENELP